MRAVRGYLIGGLLGLIIGSAIISLVNTTELRDLQRRVAEPEQVRR